MRPAPCPLLEARGIVRAYRGVRALDGVTFEIAAGEVHALVGENGAGKSTLMRILAGVEAPDAGEVWLDGAAVTFAAPRAAAEAGIGVVFQELSLADDLPVCENILANRQPTGRAGLIDRAELRRRTREMMALFDWGIDPETPVAHLDPAHRQVTEILKALSIAPRIVILDEPTSSLTSAEKECLFRVISAHRARGVAFIYISHHLPEVFRLADRITVLRDGRTAATHRRGAVTEQGLVRDMVGRELLDLYGRPAGVIGAERLRVTGATANGRFRSVSLAVRSGEIVGLAGLAGAGRTELARAIFGAAPLDEGSIAIDGVAVVVTSPADAVAHGLAYVTESRKEDGLFLDMSIARNSVAPCLAHFADRRGLLSEPAMAEHADAMIHDFGVVARGPDQPVGLLSGGNQQKVLFGMWAARAPAVLIADEPTRGVDVAARSEIYGVLRRLASAGTAVLLISSDLLELMGMSDRILVMRAGELAGEFAGSAATEEQIVACASGVDVQTAARNGSPND